MARILHLVDASPDYQTQIALEQVARNGTAKILTIGHGGDFATPLIGLMKLRNHALDCDLIHAWGEPALTLAAISGAGKRIIFSPTRFPNWRDLRWIRAVMTARDAQIICASDTMRRAYVQRGVPIERCHLIRPGVEFSRINRRRDDQLRAQLGFGPEDLVLLAAGESLRAANHHATILTSSILHLLDPQFKLLIWGRGPMLQFERNFLAKMLPQDYAAVATDKLGRDVPFERLLAATDIVLVTASGPVPPLLIAVCMAAGLPIVATVTETVAEMLEDRHSALMVKRSTSRLLARRILDLRDDPRLQWSISDAARTEAYEYFSMTRFVQQVRAVYEQVAAGKSAVEISQPAPGAGTRFFGRA
jgi:glycosyltransferase involved in cell wall biosynthesis